MRVMEPSRSLREYWNRIASARYFSRAPSATAICWACVVLAFACTQSEFPPAQWVRTNIPIHARNTVTCPKTSRPRCAIPSPVLELAEAESLGLKGEPAHLVWFLPYGDEALLARIHLMRAAQESIDIQTFLWSPDDVGALIFREMVRAAQRGVRVRLLTDAFATVRDSQLMASGVREHQNLNIKIYNPTFGHLERSVGRALRSGVCCFSGINERMHTKLMLVDGLVGIIGGRNLADEYYDRDPEGTFVDMEMLVAGPVVREMGRVFEEFWSWEFSVPARHLKDVRRMLDEGSEFRSVLDRDLDSLDEFEKRAEDYELMRERFAERALTVPGRVELFHDPPGKQQLRAEGSDFPSRAGVRQLVTSAKESLTIQTPYLLFSKGAVRAFERIRKSNPNLEIVASTNSLASADHFFTYAITFKQKRTLIKRLGFRIYELKPVPVDVEEMIPRWRELVREHSKDPEGDAAAMPAASSQGSRVMIHAKLLVVDEQIAWVGSHNFDPRSENFSTEIGVAVWDPAAARQLKSMILQMVEPQNSWVVAPRRGIPLWSKLSGFVETISRALPVGDVWPFRYSSNFELRPGMEPVPPGHPEFYKRYKPVGQFPGISGSRRAIQTRLLSAFGGFAAPLM